MELTATVVSLDHRTLILAGEPILDTSEGVLIIAFKDGSSRTFNWDYVVDFYEMTPDEYEDYLDYEEGTK